MTDQDEVFGAWLEDSDGNRWPLEANCSIGRSPSNDLVVKDRKVSRRHAVIHRQNGYEYWIVDLGSGNGTYVNSSRVALPRQLANDDTLLFGEYAIRFCHPATPDEKSRTTAIPSMTVIEVKSVKCWMLLADIINSTQLAREFDNAAWASRVGAWTGDCRQIVELHGGAVNKYLGDGFLAIWPWQEQGCDHVAAGISALLELQDSAEVPFRLAVHTGELTSGGGPTLGEDNLSGFELILLFRMEKLASSLNQNAFFSEAAADALSGSIDLAPLGEHIVQGYVDDDPRPFFGRKKT